ncbi:MAG: DUF624 domain-containing protein [Anaerolineae bacterium]|nr:DUF624 domain-containing protein [Anaerolineae bacterium]
MYRFQERYPRLAGLLDGLGMLVLSNLIWVLASAPMVTLPAATAGLFAATAPWARGHTSNLLTDFADGVRKVWLAGTLVALLDLALAALVYADLRLTATVDMPLPWVARGAALLAAAVVLLANLYLWPLLVTFRMPLRRVLSISVRLTLGHLPWSIALAALGALPILLALYAPILAVVGSFSASALLINWGAWRVIRRYVATEELATLEPPPDGSA